MFKKLTIQTPRSMPAQCTTLCMLPASCILFQPDTRSQSPCVFLSNCFSLWSKEMSTETTWICLKTTLMPNFPNGWKLCEKTKSLKTRPSISWLLPYRPVYFFAKPQTRPILASNQKSQARSKTHLFSASIMRCKHKLSKALRACSPSPFLLNQRDKVAYLIIYLGKQCVKGTGPK